MKRNKLSRTRSKKRKMNRKTRRKKKKITKPKKIKIMKGGIINLFTCDGKEIRILKEPEPSSEDDNVIIDGDLWDYLREEDTSIDTIKDGAKKIFGTSDPEDLEIYENKCVEGNKKVGDHLFDGSDETPINLYFEIKRNLNLPVSVWLLDLIRKNQVNLNI